MFDNQFVLSENEFVILENIFNNRKWALDSTLEPHKVGASKNIKRYEYVI